MAHELDDVVLSETDEAGLDAEIAALRGRIQLLAAALEASDAEEEDEEEEDEEEEESDIEGADASDQLEGDADGGDLSDPPTTTWPGAVRRRLLEEEGLGTCGTDEIPTEDTSERQAAGTLRPAAPPLDADETPSAGSLPSTSASTPLHGAGPAPSWPEGESDEVRALRADIRALEASIAQQTALLGAKRERLQALLAPASPATTPVRSLLGRWFASPAPQGDEARGSQGSRRARSTTLLPV
eukprot:TRINITY_DN5713_c0_g1_i1.p1 TRINITY_DN5713_c0_g1~~TRINITY_DN5713_c0_g1_i1.p1  ORF type:complete len:261 (+),score=80.29 TRINITY_DN5713_c0_g1_i1:58-783(+)